MRSRARRMPELISKRLKRSMAADPCRMVH